MEISGTEEVKMAEGHMISAAAFVEGGVQDACDDSCSICLEAFCDANPSTVTTCKHEFHLQCILEWCQRSSNCPMCWQTIGLKNPSSQELLDAVERERRFRLNPARNATIFRHPTLGDFELQHLPMGSNDSEMEERIIQHLAAAAAMGRARHIARREASRGRSSAHGRPHFLVFSSHANDDDPASASVAPVGEPDRDSTVLVNPSLPSGWAHNDDLSSIASDQVSASSSGTVHLFNRHRELSVDNRSSTRTEPSSHDGAGPSELNSISESWKSRWNALSGRYKESLSKSTRGWKDRLFSRSSSMADIGTDVKREVNAGIASVSRMMERLEARDNTNSGPFSTSNNPSVTQQNNHDNSGNPDGLPLRSNSLSADSTLH